MTSADRPATRLATRLAFLVAGFGVACWAPLIPYAKARLAVDDGVLGLLLLCLGIGSVIAMPLTGIRASTTFSATSPSIRSVSKVGTTCDMGPPSSVTTAAA